MTRETAVEKAGRLLTGGDVRVTEVGPGRVTATVSGSTGTYVVTRRRGGWHCPCAAHGRCSHLTAVQLVVHPLVDLSPAGGAGAWL